MEAAPFGDVGVIAPGHQGNVVGVTDLGGNLVDHSLYGSALVLSAKGHKNSARADGAVKPFGKSAL